jgi:hemerythrin superfamily protein
MSDVDNLPDRTVTEILHEQHELVRDLFGQVRAATGAERVETFDCLRALLAVHETAEEEVVHPAARKVSDEASAAVKLRLDEEDKAKRMLADLEKLGPDGDGFDELLATFEQAVLAHAEAEETEVFPLLDAALDAETLAGMTTALIAAERMAPTHAHPHSPESKIGNVLTGPFVAMIDRVRDAIRGHAA